MAKPTVQSWNALKRLCRYLVGLPRLVYTYKWQEVKAIDIYTDTDWAGCPRTRKSTSGGCVLLGAHAIKTWSSTQSSVALPSGEAEFNGVVKGAGIGLGYQGLLRDLGQDIPVRVWTDSSASIGICSRQGLGKLRHLDTHTPSGSNKPSAAAASTSGRSWGTSTPPTCSPSMLLPWSSCRSFPRVFEGQRRHDHQGTGNHRDA